MNETVGALRQTSAEDSGTIKTLTRQGQVLGETYLLLDRIGAGGMAEVYAAEHIRLGRQFAVKLLHRDHGPSALTRFRREAKAVARVRNDFVVDIVDAGEADGVPYLVMELLSGEDLRSLLAELKVLPIQRAVNLVWEACQGIAAVHQAGLVHRDLKPENLFVSKRSTGEDWCKILDFGIAKSDLSGSTSEGALIGTVRYMAPEQLQDGASAGPSVDVYALGAVLYELLSGTSLHSAVTVQELMFKVLNVEPLRLERLRAEVPGALADAVHRAVATDLEQRFATVVEFARAIAPFASRTVSAAASARDQTLSFEEAAARPARSARPRRWPVALGLLLSTGGGFLARGLVSNPPSASASVFRPVAAARPATALVAPSSPQPNAVERTHPAPTAAPSTLPSPPPPATPAPRAAVAPARLQPKLAAVPPHQKALAPRAVETVHAATFDNENPYPR